MLGLKLNHVSKRGHRCLTGNCLFLYIYIIIDCVMVTYFSPQHIVPNYIYIYIFRIMKLNYCRCSCTYPYALRTYTFSIVSTFLNSGSRRSQLPVWTNKQPTRMQLLNCSLRWLPLYMIILRIDPMPQKICTWFIALYRMIYLTTIFRRDSTVIRQLYDLVRLYQRWIS